MELKNDLDQNSLERSDSDEFSQLAYSDDEPETLTCWDCDVNFTSKEYLYKHLFHHIKQPVVKLIRNSLPPLKITFKSKSGNNFEIVHSPTNHVKTQDNQSDKLEESTDTINTEESSTEETAESGQTEKDSNEEQDYNEFDSATLEDINGIIENEKTSEMVTGPIITEVCEDENAEQTITAKENYDTIPGAEPTPPPEPLPETYPKIRIKTTGLLKDPLESSCTITELTDDTNGNLNDSSNGNHLWSSPLEDPLKLPVSDENILSLFNNNERAKDFGFTTSDSEFMPLDRLDSRNSGALQLYNPPTSGSQNPLDNLTGLPMQALAQQVSRLQPSGNGMHQQNVLINIQQFPQAPAQSPYQSPHMYHHSGQPMYPPPPPPYPYQPPNPMYYPPNPSYPPQHMQQPPQIPSMNHQMGQPQPNNQNQMAPPPMSQAQMLPPPSRSSPQNQPQYRQTVSRPPGPRQPLNMRGPVQRQPSMNPRVGPPTAMRQRVPLIRPRGATVTPIRGGIRPRSANDSIQIRGPNSIKRPMQEHQIKQEDIKKKRFDVLTPEKDDEDCQVICMQPKNTDGLPQIESVQGALSDSVENSIMHLSDSITLSVRNPPPKPASPKKSDAKAVANILATRGITVTPTAKPKPDKPAESGTKTQAPTSLNLNGAVSIIPSAKQQSQQVKKQQDGLPPTVDLTDESMSVQPPIKQQQNSPQKSTANIGLPYRCYLCPAQYPNALGLSKHRQNYHKTSGGSLDIGIPLINLKQPGVIQKMNSLGIHNFIPLPTSQPDGTFAVPIINAKHPGNVHQMGASTMLVLGPVKTIPRPNGPNNMANKSAGAHQQK